MAEAVDRTAWAGSDADLPVVIYGAKSTEDVRGSIPTQLEDAARLFLEDRPERDFVVAMADLGAVKPSA